MAVAKGGTAVKIRATSQRRKCAFIFFFFFFFFLFFPPFFFLVCAPRGPAGRCRENRQCLICYDMNTQLDHRVQILQSAVRCQAALRGSSSGSEPVTHHIKITGESEAFFLSNQLTLQEMVTRAFGRSARRFILKKPPQAPSGERANAWEPQRCFPSQLRGEISL